MRIIPFVALIAAVVASPGAAAERRFTITGFERVRLEGPFAVVLTTNKAPSAKASGSASALDRVVVEVQGQTLVIRRDRDGWGGAAGDADSPVEIAVSTHGLTAASVNGSGSLRIDRVRGLKFDLSVAGAGSAEIASVDVDQLRVGLMGSAVGKLSGEALRLNASVDGASALQGSGLSVKDAVVAAGGPTSVAVTATDTAKVNARGAAMIQLQGRPACTNRLEGSATVEGCK